jgi:hypoxanthine phosphoribosyltransferase
MVDNLKTKTLISREQLSFRIKELAEEINKDFAGKEIVLVGILKGSFMFLSDLAREINLPVKIEFMSVSSYEGKSSSGQVRINYDIGRDIQDENIIVVEDIVDTGLTIDYLVKYFSVRNPNSVRICSLLSKPESYKLKHKIDYVGFEISNEFVIGYGLDLDGRYRELPEILQVLD